MLALSFGSGVRRSRRSLSSSFLVKLYKLHWFGRGSHCSQLSVNCSGFDTAITQPTSPLSLFENFLHSTCLTKETQLKLWEVSNGESWLGSCHWINIFICRLSHMHLQLSLLPEERSRTALSKCFQFSSLGPEAQGTPWSSFGDTSRWLCPWLLRNLPSLTAIIIHLTLLHVVSSSNFEEYNTGFNLCGRICFSVWFLFPEYGTVWHQRRGSRSHTVNPAFF